MTGTKPQEPARAGRHPAGIPLQINAPKPARSSARAQPGLEPAGHVGMVAEGAG